MSIQTELFQQIPGIAQIHQEGSAQKLTLFDGTTRYATTAEILTATKTIRIEADRTECRRRLTEYYGDAFEQVSRASGLYGATAQANHAAGVSAAIDASNVARDLINAATTVAEVEAVTVAWPLLI